MWLISCIFVFISAIEASDNPWRSLAIQDINFIHQQILANHPGPVDPANSKFITDLKKNFQQALELADDADSPEHYFFSLRKFIAGFRDGHVGLNLKLDLKKV